MDLLEQLEGLDFHQEEILTKLQVRLTNELAMKDKCIHQMAVEDSTADQLKIGVWDLPESTTAQDLLDESEKRIEKLKANRLKVLLTLKSSVWNASNSLKKIHEKRNILWAQYKEQEELQEA